MAKKLGVKYSEEGATDIVSDKLVCQESTSITDNLLSSSSLIESGDELIKVVEDFLDDPYDGPYTGPELIYIDEICSKVHKNSKNLGKYEGLMITFEEVIRDMIATRPRDENWWGYFDHNTREDITPHWFTIFVSGIKKDGFTSETSPETIRKYLLRTVVDN